MSSFFSSFPFNKCGLRECGCKCTCGGECSHMFTDIDEDGIIQDAFVSKGTAPDVLLRSV